MESEATSITQFSLTDLAADKRFPLWKESISVIFDVDWDTDDCPTPFDARLISAHLGQLLLVETTSVEQDFDRTALRIRQDGIDHCLIQIYLEGETRGLWGQHDHSTARPGDVLFLDTAQTVQSRVSPFRNLTLLVPRTLLIPHLGDPECHHGRILPRESASGRLLGEHLSLLWNLLKTTPAAEAQQIGLGLLDLIGRYFGGSRVNGKPMEMPQTALALRELIRAYIEQSLERSDLGVETLMHRFGLSRSALFSLFKPLGGVSAYIQDCRLLRAHVRLMSTPYRSANITRLAFDLGFKHPSHFSRAFRDKFGYSPSEATEHAFVRRSPIADESTGVDRSYEQWVRELR
ncbi:MAG: hypothetical protein RLZZ09_1742 [Pseudomonadota bacterium]|jgi:AraC-like DNA-binding protein